MAPRTPHIEVVQTPDLEVEAPYGPSAALRAFAHVAALRYEVALPPRLADEDGLATPLHMQDGPGLQLPQRHVVPHRIHPERVVEPISTVSLVERLGGRLSGGRRDRAVNTKCSLAVPARPKVFTTGIVREP